MHRLGREGGQAKSDVLGAAGAWRVAAGATELPWTAPSTPGLCLVRATPDDGRPATARVMVIH